MIAEQARNELSHTTINNALHGKTVPTWSTWATIIGALGGDEGELYQLYAPPQDDDEEYDEDSEGDTLFEVDGEPNPIVLLAEAIQELAAAIREAADRPAR